MKNRLLNRLKSFNTNDIIIFITMLLADVLGFYMSIGMTVKISQGKTLFGDSGNYETGTVETATTSSDLLVMSFFWILSILVLLLLIYLVFFKKIEHKKVVKKEIVNGKTVIVKEEDEHPETENNTDLEIIKECEFIRYESKGDTLVLQLVADSKEEHDHEEDEEEHDDCCHGLNGRLILITFIGVKNLTVSGDECDNYILKESIIENKHISLSYEGLNLSDEDSEYHLSFDYSEYSVEDRGIIESPEV